MNQALHQRGFTLIEMLVVVTVIIILMAIVAASLWQGAKKARDAKRYTDLREVQLALEAYGKTYDGYPSAADGNCTYTTSFQPGGCLEVLVEKGFFNALPTPPENSTYGYYYDNFCRLPAPAAANSGRYRMWTHGEQYNDGLAGNWWYPITIGFASCSDPT